MTEDFQFYIQELDACQQHLLLALATADQTKPLNALILRASHRLRDLSCLSGGGILLTLQGQIATEAAPTTFQLVMNDQTSTPLYHLELQTGFKKTIFNLDAQTNLKAKETGLEWCDPTGQTVTFKPFDWLSGLLETVVLVRLCCLENGLGQRGEVRGTAHVGLGAQQIMPFFENLG